jgi:S-(hydroxymethyl)glutathione dehydrogenase/alcohol dehydrogenase
VVVRVAAVGICGTDLHSLRGEWNRPTPMVLGHEGAGVIEAVGPGVTRVKVGDHVVCSFIPACGICRYCSTGRQNLCDWGAQMMTGMLADGTFRFHDDDGADLGGFCMLGTFAERAVISQNSCVPIEKDIPFEVAALTGCGVPTGWGTAVYAAGVRAGETVVIFGAGGVGTNAVQGARYAGAAHVIVIDPVEFKRENALAFGATHVFASADLAQEAVIELTRGQMADHALITVGVLSEEVVEQATAIVGKGAQVTITSVGKSAEKQIHLAANGSVVGWQRNLQGHVFGMCNPLNDIPRLLRLYRAGQLKLEELITRRYSLDEVNQGYQDLDDGKLIRGVILHG